MVRYILKDVEEGYEQKILKIDLDRDGDSIDLVVEDEKGNRYPVLGLYNDGTITRYKKFPKDIGIQKDEEGRIKEVEY